MSRSRIAAEPASPTRLVVVARFQTLIEAEQARFVLEDAGIRTFFGGAEIVGTAWYLGTAVGHISVEVGADDELRARNVLQARMPGLFIDRGSHGTKPDELKCLSCQEQMETSQEKCENCGWSYASDHVSAEPSGFRPISFLRRFTRPVLALWLLSGVAVMVATLLNLVFALFGAQRLEFNQVAATMVGVLSIGVVCWGVLRILHEHQDTA